MAEHAPCAATPCVSTYTYRLVYTVGGTCSLCIESDEHVTYAATYDTTEDALMVASVHLRSLYTGPSRVILALDDTVIRTDADVEQYLSEFSVCIDDGDAGGIHYFSAVLVEYYIRTDFRVRTVQQLRMLAEFVGMYERTLVATDLRVCVSVKKRRMCTATKSAAPRSAVIPPL